MGGYEYMEIKYPLVLETLASTDWVSEGNPRTEIP